MKTKHKEFNAFDKVLIKDNKWQIDLYSYWDEENNSHHTMSFGGGLDIYDDEILPFEEYSHLLGTTDEPEEEIKLEEGEWCIFADRIEAFTKMGIVSIHKGTIIDVFADEVGRYWEYAIRFSDFNPEDMEETKKHILCVRNGKIVKMRNS